MDISAEKEDIKIRQIYELKLAKYKSVSDTLKVVISVEETCLVFSPLLGPAGQTSASLRLCPLVGNISWLETKFTANILQRHVATLN